MIEIWKIILISPSNQHKIHIISPVYTHTVGHVKHIFLGIKLDTPGVIKPGVGSYAIHRSSFGIHAVFMAAYMSFSTTSYCPYNTCGEGETIVNTFLALEPIGCQGEWEIENDAQSPHQYVL